MTFPFSYHIFIPPSHPKVHFFLFCIFAAAHSKHYEKRLYVHIFICCCIHKAFKVHVNMYSGRFQAMSKLNFCVPLVDVFQDVLKFVFVIFSLYSN